MLCSAICMNSIAHVGMAAIAATSSRRDCRQVSMTICVHLPRRVPPRRQGRRAREAATSPYMVRPVRAPSP